MFICFDPLSCSKIHRSSFKRLDVLQRADGRKLAAGTRDRSAAIGLAQFKDPGGFIVDFLRSSLSHYVSRIDVSYHDHLVLALLQHFLKIYHGIHGEELGSEISYGFHSGAGLAADVYQNRGLLVDFFSLYA